MSIDELTNKSKCLVDFQGLGEKKENMSYYTCFIYIITVNFIRFKIQTQTFSLLFM